MDFSALVVTCKPIGIYGDELSGGGGCSSFKTISGAKCSNTIRAEL